jgi:hypothetical protein
VGCGVLASNGDDTPDGAGVVGKIIVVLDTADWRFLVNGMVKGQSGI